MQVAAVADTALDTSIPNAGDAFVLDAAADRRSMTADVDAIFIFLVIDGVKCGN